MEQLLTRAVVERKSHVSVSLSSFSVLAGDIRFFFFFKDQLADSDCIPTLGQTLSRAGGLLASTSFYQRSCDDTGFL